MILDINSIMNMILTAGILSLCGIAWGTYNKFVLMLAKVEYIIERLKQSDETHKEIFNRLRDIENRLNKIEK
jgi:hypothetical protein